MRLVIFGIMNCKQNKTKTKTSTSTALIFTLREICNDRMPAEHRHRIKALRSSDSPLSMLIFYLQRFHVLRYVASLKHPQVLLIKKKKHVCVFINVHCS